MRRPRYADVTATLALIVALGGTSYAVTALPRDSVGTAQLKDRAVTRAKLAAGLAKAGTRGRTGPAGPAGPAGAPGVPGPPGISDVVMAMSTPFGVPSGSEATATCPPGKTVIGGGGLAQGMAPNYLVRSYPSTDRRSWIAVSGGAVGSTSTAWVICATVLG
jgi:hypothetical protein